MLTPLLLLHLSATPAPTMDRFLTEYAESGKYLLGRPTQAKLTPDGAAVLFLRSEAKSRAQTLFELNLATGQTREILTPAQLTKGKAEELSIEERARLERMRISARGFTGFALSKDGEKVAVTMSGKLFLFSRATGAVTELKAGDGVRDPQFAPNSRAIAFVRDFNLHVMDLVTGKSRAITKGGSAARSFGEAEYVAQEEMGRFHGFWWSPDSKALAYQETDTTAVEKLAMVDVMHPEKGAHEFAYPRPGRPNAKVALWVAQASGAGAPVSIRWDAEAFPYVATVKWKKGPLTLVVQSRSQQVEAVLAVDARNGKTRELLREQDDAWVNLDQDFPQWLDEGTGFFWRTERNGAPEVELRDAKGERVKTIIPPTAGFADWAGYDAKTKTAYFTGGLNPTESLLYKIEDAGAPVKLSVEPGWMTATYSEESGQLLVNATSLSSMPTTRVLRADGGQLAQLPSVALTPPFTPNVELVKVGAGEGLYAAVIRPRDFKPGRKLPVIVEVYGGPHHQEAKNTQREHLLSQWFADQGFCVVKIDNRGTPRRGRAFERAIRGDFATASVEDQVAGIRALGEKFPELDMARVGISGWSFGGYMAALALLKRPDVYKTAVAGAPVVDWRAYDTHYTERYLGVPASDEDAAYQVSSLLTYAPKLERPLLLIHGTADDNVYFLHSLKLSHALFLAGRPHELLPLSGLTHMVPDPLVMQRLYGKMAEHFKRHLTPAP